MVAAQEVTVRTEVVRTVSVVRPSAAAVVAASAAVLLTSASTSVGRALPVEVEEVLGSAVMVLVEFWRRNWKCL